MTTHLIPSHLTMATVLTERYFVVDVDTIRTTIRNPFYVGGTKYNSTMNERDKMDWEKVIDWDRVANLTDDEVDVILGIFEKGQ